MQFIFHVLTGWLTAQRPTVKLKQNKCSANYTNNKLTDNTQ